MLSGIRGILIITTLKDSAAFQALLGDGQRCGIQFADAVQPSPDGLAQAGRQRFEQRLPDQGFDECFPGREGLLVHARFFSFNAPGLVT